MAASSTSLHEDPEKLNSDTIDRHRAIVSLMEELEAVDWYDQRIDAASDDALRQILTHNRDEEKEHAAMVMEWLRRHDEALDRQLRNYLFTGDDIAERAARLEEEGESEAKSDGSLGIGSLRAARP